MARYPQGARGHPCGRAAEGPGPDSPGNRRLGHLELAPERVASRKPLAPGFVFALQGLRRLLSRSAIVAQISQSGLYSGYHLPGKFPKESPLRRPRRQWRVTGEGTRNTRHPSATRHPHTVLRGGQTRACRDDPGRRARGRTGRSPSCHRAERGIRKQRHAAIVVAVARCHDVVRLGGPWKPRRTRSSCPTPTC
jgi:hypothetical protein